MMMEIPRLGKGNTENEQLTKTYHLLNAFFPV